MRSPLLPFLCVDTTPFPKLTPGFLLLFVDIFPHYGRIFLPASRPKSLPLPTRKSCRSHFTFDLLRLRFFFFIFTALRTWSPSPPAILFQLSSTTGPALFGCVEIFFHWNVHFSPAPTSFFPLLRFSRDLNSLPGLGDLPICNETPFFNRISAFLYRSRVLPPFSSWISDARWEAFSAFFSIFLLNRHFDFRLLLASG